MENQSGMSLFKQYCFSLFLNFARVMPANKEVMVQVIFSMVHSVFPNESDR